MWMWSRSKKIMALINENGAEKENINKENIQPDSDDSVKDPNYSIIPQHKVQIDSSSDEEEYCPTEEPTNTVLKRTSESASVISSLSIISDNNVILDAPTSTTLEVIAPSTMEVIPSSTNITTESAPTSTLTPTKRGRKRQRNEEGWKRNIAKRLRNNGK
ncbi:unnamed protein product [Parnassius mnemosyne]|uniref:Uncharacterized protein n=1 Tax=Parnassius mnemosyne TaxID=213953 RepID=A0AAV1KV02_9NEOP